MSLIAKIHLHDFTLGAAKEPACGKDNIPVADLRMSDTFGQIPPEDRCKRCDEQHRVAQTYELTCQICRQAFTSAQAVLDHAHRVRHVLELVSYRNQTPVFVVSVRQYYDRAKSVARALAQAQAELQQYFPEREYCFCPHEHAIEGHSQYTTVYLVIPR